MVINNEKIEDEGNILPDPLPLDGTPHWDDVVLPLGFRQNIQRSVLTPVLEGKSPVDYSFIIFGPPGTGKTTLLKSIAKILDWELIYIGPQHFLRKDLTPELAMKRCIQEIKNMAVNAKKKNKPIKTVFVFDEIDELVVTRGSSSDRQTRFATTLMLPLIQELRDLAKKLCFVFFFLTNHIERFDPAITRQGRFDLILPLGPPDRLGRYLLFEKFIGEINRRLQKEGKEILLEYFYSVETTSKNKEVFTDFLTDLDVVSRASARLTLKDIETVCERVVEQGRAFLPGSKTIYLHTKNFIDWIYKYRNLKENKESIDNYYKHYAEYLRGSTIYSKPNTIQELVEKEFSSLHIIHNLNELDGVWKVGKKKTIKFSFRNLSGLSVFHGQIKIIVHNGSEIKTKSGDEDEFVPQSSVSEEYELDITPKKSGKMEITFTIEGIFELLGIEEVMVGNIAHLRGRISHSRDIKIIK